MSASVPATCDISVQLQLHLSAVSREELLRRIEKNGSESESSKFAEPAAFRQHNGRRSSGYLVPSGTRQRLNAPLNLSALLEEWLIFSANTPMWRKPWIRPIFRTTSWLKTSCRPRTTKTYMARPRRKQRVYPIHFMFDLAELCRGECCLFLIFQVFLYSAGSNNTPSLHSSSLD